MLFSYFGLREEALLQILLLHYRLILLLNTIGLQVDIAKRQLYLAYKLHR